MSRLRPVDSINLRNTLMDQLKNKNYRYIHHTVVPNRIHYVNWSEEAVKHIVDNKVTGSIICITSNMYVAAMTLNALYVALGGVAHTAHLTLVTYYHNIKVIPKEADHFRLQGLLPDEAYYIGDEF